MKSDPWNVQKSPAPRTLGSLAPQLGSLELGPSIKEQAREARAAYEDALTDFERERSLAAKERRPMHPGFGAALYRAYDQCDRLSAKASWARMAGEMGGGRARPAQHAHQECKVSMPIPAASAVCTPRGRWKSGAPGSLARDFQRPPLRV